MAGKLTIGKVAKLAGVNIQTIRFYERKNLLLPSGRKKSVFAFSHDGYRVYDEDAVKKILFIKNAQKIGFSLKEIKELLRLRVNRSVQCKSVKAKAERKLQEVKEKIQDLNAMERVLSDLVRTCRSKAATDNCPILKSLEIQT